MIGELLYTSQQRRGSMDQHNSIAAGGPPGDQIASSSSEESSNETDDSTLPSDLGEEKSELLEEIQRMKKEQQEANKRTNERLKSELLLEEIQRMKKEQQEANKRTNERLKELEKKADATIGVVFKLEKDSERNRHLLEEILKRVTSRPPHQAATFLSQGARPKTFSTNGSSGPGCAHMIPTSVTGCHSGSGDGGLCLGGTQTTSTISQSVSFGSPPSPTNTIEQPLVSLRPQNSGIQRVSRTQSDHTSSSNSEMTSSATIPHGAKLKAFAMSSLKMLGFSNTIPASTGGCGPIGDRPSYTGEVGASNYVATCLPPASTSTVALAVKELSFVPASLGLSVSRDTGCQQISTCTAQNGYPTSSEVAQLHTYPALHQELINLARSKSIDSDGSSLYELTFKEVSPRGQQKLVLLFKNMDTFYFNNSFRRCDRAQIQSIADSFQTSLLVEPDRPLVIPRKNDLTECQMYELAEKLLGPSWRSIGIQLLDLATNDISRIEAEFPRRKDTVFHMIRTCQTRLLREGREPIPHIRDKFHGSDDIDQDVIDYLDSLMQ